MLKGSVVVTFHSNLQPVSPLSCMEHFSILQLIVLVYCFHWYHFQQQWEQKADVFNEKL